MSAPIPTRRPLLDALKSTSWRTLAGSAVTAAVAFGVLDSVQADLANNLVAAAVTLVTAGTGLWHSFAVVKAGEPKVTPTTDPRTDDGTPLVPDTAPGLASDPATPAEPPPAAP